MPKPVENVSKSFLEFIRAQQREHLETRSRKTEKNVSQNDNLLFLLCIWNYEGNKENVEKARHGNLYGWLTGSVT